MENILAPGIGHRNVYWITRKIIILTLAIIKHLNCITYELIVDKGYGTFDSIDMDTGVLIL